MEAAADQNLIDAREGAVVSHASRTIPFPGYRQELLLRYICSITTDWTTV